MKRYEVTEILGSFELFIGDEVEAKNEVDAKEQILNEILDNLGNYIDIEIEEVNDYEDGEEE
jgi:hypothetical protein